MERMNFLRSYSNSNSKFTIHLIIIQLKYDFRNSTYFYYDVKCKMLKSDEKCNIVNNKIPDVLIVYESKLNIKKESSKISSRFSAIKNQLPINRFRY